MISFDFDLIFNSPVKSAGTDTRSKENTLPLNRKERYWTSCVFPQIVCNADFKDLSRFLKLIELPDRFIKPSYSNEDIIFYTEYNLKESALKWDETKSITKDTPDVLIMVKNIDEWYLVLIEAKMYDAYDPIKLKDQILAQKKIAVTILKHNNIPESNFKHVCLLLDSDDKTKKSIYPDKLIHWNDIISLYPEKSGEYFYEMLKKAVSSHELKSKGGWGGSGQNKTGTMTYNQIIDYFNQNGDFFVGRNDGIETVYDDCRTGKVRSKKYEVNIEINPDNFGPFNKNWVYARDFIDALKKFEII